TPEPAAGAAAYALLKLLAAHGSPSLPLGLRTGVVVNMAHDPHEAGQVAGRLAQAARDFLGLDLAFLGGIPPDRYVGLAARARRPLALCHPHAPANTAIAKICGRFLPPAAAARAEPGLWARLAGLLL
ncbi:MAG: MinD/ParA family protein, partial [Planctomycetota bacterium]